jgi:hypothetical protein
MPFHRTSEYLHLIDPSTTEISSASRLCNRAVRSCVWRGWSRRALRRARRIRYGRSGCGEQLMQDPCGRCAPLLPPGPHRRQHHTGDEHEHYTSGPKQYYRLVDRDRGSATTGHYSDRYPGDHLAAQMQHTQPAHDRSQLRQSGTWPSTRPARATRAGTRPSAVRIVTPALASVTDNRQRGKQARR